MKKERIYYFDYIKAFLITLVVLGHCMTENTFFHKYIYSWHMSAFFIINGMLLKYTEFETKKFFGKSGVLISNIKKLMIPYLIYGFILLFARWCFSGFDISNLRWQLIDLFSLSGVGATWFLSCLFVAQIICFFVMKLSSKFRRDILNNTIIILFIALLFVLVFLFPIKKYVFLILNRSLLAAAFCLIGVVAFKCAMKLRCNKTWVACVLSVLVMIISVTFFMITGQNDASINVLRIGNPFLFLINSILGSLIPITLFVVLDRIKKVRIEKALAFFGIHSLTVMGTHQVIMLLLRIPISESLFMNVLFCFLIMLIEIPVCLFVYKLKLIGAKHD